MFEDTAEGSRVASVQAQSPLAGRIWPGDVVLMINDKDVSTCSAGIIKVFLKQKRENVLTIRHDSGNGGLSDDEYEEFERRRQKAMEDARREAEAKARREAEAAATARAEAEAAARREAEAKARRLAGLKTEYEAARANGAPNDTVRDAKEGERGGSARGAAARARAARATLSL